MWGSLAKRGRKKDKKRSEMKGKKGEQNGDTEGYREDMRRAREACKGEKSAKEQVGRCSVTDELERKVWGTEKEGEERGKSPSTIINYGIFISCKH